jgi:hypothetical protein
MSDRAAARAVPARATAPRAAAKRTTTPRTTIPRAPGRATPVRPGPDPAGDPPAAAKTGAKTAVKTAPKTAATPARRRSRARTSPTIRRAPFVLLVVALLIGTTLGLLILNTAIAVDSLKATQLQAENAERAQEVQRLEQRVVAGGSPAQIASAAVAAGLVPAGPAAYLLIAPDGTVTLRGAPVPAPDPAAEPTDGG